jgi:hypothetical protein
MGSPILRDWRYNDKSLMAKPPRSPLLGYNHNLTHLGRVFHIQTEDSGPISPRLFTHLFYEGTILVSRKHQYDASLADDKVRALMQAQHKTVMKDLLRARLDEVIRPFFAARGEDLFPVQGAVPSAPLSETPGPVMVLPNDAPVSGATLELGGTAGAAIVAVNGAEATSAEATSTMAFGDGGLPYDPAPAAPASPPPPTHRRTATRSFEPVGPRGPAIPVVVRAPDAARSPFVRNGTPAASRMASADGVVVQRNLVVGAGPASSQRPARIRPPVPYVVTGGGHTERPPRAAATAPVAKQSGGSSPAAVSGMITASPLPPLAAGAPLSPADSVPLSSAGAFGVGLADDKSLDEVILEYLSDDSDGG